MQLVNLTSEEINLVYDEGDFWIMTLPPSGKVARVVAHQEAVGKIVKWPLWDISSPRVVDLPEPKEGLCYLVSKEVAQVAKRRDVVSLDIGSATLRNGEQVTVALGFLTFS
jgi:hypothetical protein